ncbi:hypothetical protein FKM82_018642 [Ascaphus truei]
MVLLLHPLSFKSLRSRMRVEGWALAVASPSFPQTGEVCNRGFVPVQKGASNPAVWWLTAGSQLTNTTWLIRGWLEKPAFETGREIP